jgi:uncharacterized membrane protein YqaE (UPF0057 family)
MNKEDLKLLAIIVSIFFPPLGVFLVEGFGLAILVNFILTCMFWLPGFIHSLYVILRKKD